MKAATTSKLDAGVDYLTLNLHGLSDAGGGDGIYSCSIFITIRKVKQEVLNIVNGQLLQLLLQRRTHSPKLGERYLT